MYALHVVRTALQVHFDLKSHASPELTVLVPFLLVPCALPGQNVVLRDAINCVADAVLIWSSDSASPRNRSPYTEDPFLLSADIFCACTIRVQ